MCISYLEKSILLPFNLLDIGIEIAFILLLAYLFISSLLVNSSLKNTFWFVVKKEFHFKEKIMQFLYARTSLTFYILILTLTFNIGCVISVIEQNQEAETIEKPQESYVTVVDTSDTKNPIVVGKLNLPFKSGLNNNIVLSRKYGYVTADKHLLVLDISNPQQPSYITSLSFPGKLDKAHISQDKVIVSGNEKIYLIDISNPHEPVLQSQVSLHHSNSIHEFDIYGSYLYVLDVNNYLHIYHLTDDNVLLVKTDELQYPSDLVGVLAKGAEAEQIMLKYKTSSDHGWLTLSDRVNLLDFNGVHHIVRNTEDHLVFSSPRNQCRDISVVLDADLKRPFIWGYMEDYNIEANYLAHLYLTGKRTLPRGTPTEAYLDKRNKIQFVSQDQWVETVEYQENQLIGAITDFQILDSLLFVTNSKGFLSILDLDAPVMKRFISGISLQSSNPTSIAVGENHVYVLSPQE